MNNSELVQGLRRRDPAAKQWLCDCLLPSLWRFVFSRVHGDQHLAEDITHESILAMLTSIQFGSANDSEIVNPAGWLRTVAGRRISDHFRAVTRVQHLLPQSPNQPGEADCSDPARHHELQETRAEVRHAMDKLSDEYRLALEWKYLDQLSVRDIASRLGMTEKAAESILFRARRELRQQLVEKTPLPAPTGNGKPKGLAESIPVDEQEDALHKSK